MLLPYISEKFLQQRLENARVMCQTVTSTRSIIHFHSGLEARFPTATTVPIDCNSNHCVTPSN